MNSDQMVLTGILFLFGAALVILGQIVLIIIKALGLITWGWGLVLIPGIVLVTIAIAVAGIWAIATLVTSFYD